MMAEKEGGTIKKIGMCDSDNYSISYKDWRNRIR